MEVILAHSALLVLEDGTVFKGISIGADGCTVGEVVFNTSMTGYQEILTDPSYTKQIVTLTYPHIGNYGINKEDQESSKIHLQALVIRNYTMIESNFRSEESLSDYLNRHNVLGIANIDTRKLTRILRTKGSMAGCIMAGAELDEQEALNQAKGFAGLKGMDLAKEVTTDRPYEWKIGTWSLGQGYASPEAEDLKYNPHSPYSAAKASSDHFVRAFHDTYGMPTIVTNCSNNYGPYQFPEKLIPLFINNIRHRKPLPVYGKGENVRDWLYVEDHARAIDLIFHKGKVAETYNIGGFNEWKNIDIIKVVINTVDRILGRKEGEDMDLITYVTDRAGHDLRYAIDSRKLQRELGWEPSLQFEEGIEKTVRWYLDNQEWMDNITSGEYEKYYDDMYKNR